MDLVRRVSGLLSGVSLPAPRFSLFFFAQALKIAAVVVSGLGMVSGRGWLLILGAPLWLAWLGLVFVIASPRTDELLWQRRATLAWGAAVLFILLLTGGLLELALVADIHPGRGLQRGADQRLGQSLEALERSPGYNDSTALTHQAVLNILAGKNPYREANIMTALVSRGGTFDRVTPLRRGRLAGRIRYPDKAELRKIWEDAGNDFSHPPPELATGYPYPAAAFMLPAPFLLAGIDDLRTVYGIFALLAIAVIAVLARKGRRLIWIGAALVSLELWTSLADGETGLLPFALVLIAWALVRRNPTLSAVVMGLAAATKQTVWFIVPFYLIFLLRNLGPKRAAVRAGVLAGIFLAVNAPFIVDGPRLWLASLMAPQLDPLFPLGIGLVTLVRGGLVSVASPTIFTMMEGIAAVFAVAWYWLEGRTRPHTGLVLGVLPLFFAWRSLWSYFFFTGLLVLGAVVTDARNDTSGASVRAAGPPPI